MTQQPEASWEKEFDKNFTRTVGEQVKIDEKNAEYYKTKSLAPVLVDVDDKILVDASIDKLKAFIHQAIEETVSAREKEIEESVKNLNKRVVFTVGEKIPKEPVQKLLGTIYGQNLYLDEGPRTEQAVEEFNKWYKTLTSVQRPVKKPIQEWLKEKKKYVLHKEHKSAGDPCWVCHYDRGYVHALGDVEDYLDPADK